MEDEMILESPDHNKNLTWFSSVQNITSVFLVDLVYVVKNKFDIIPQMPFSISARLWVIWVFSRI